MNVIVVCLQSLMTVIIKLFQKETYKNKQNEQKHKNKKHTKFTEINKNEQNITKQIHK